MLNEYTFMSLALITLVAASFKFVKSSVVSVLDKRIKAVESSYAKAETMKNQMHDELLTLKQQYLQTKERHKSTIQEAREEADAIISNALEQIEQLSDKTIDVLKAYRKNIDNMLIEDLKSEILLTVLTVLEKEMSENKSEKVRSINESITALKKFWH